MKKLFNYKKIFIGAMSATLVLVVIATAIPFSISALTPTNPINTTQTGFENLITYQTDKWAEIANGVFGDTLDDPNTVPTLYGVQNNTRAIVQDGNQYFNWKKGLDASVKPWDGTASEVTPVEETIDYSGDSVTGGNGSVQTQADFSVTYTVYNVSTASELRYAMAQAETMQKSQNTKINLTSDIDLNGAENTWIPMMFDSMNDKWFYFEGNGHTIYNMECYNTKASGQYGNGGFFGNFGSGSGRLVVKNLNFSNCMSLSLDKQATAVAVGYISCRAYLENINVYDSFVFSNADQTGTLIGRTQSGSGDIFLRNCSSQNCYVYGKNHSGGLTGCQHNTGNYKVKYDAKFPASPEAWLQKIGTVYPEIVENCYSVDCTLFSVGNAGDSGGFISCGGKFICRNCFTNNTVYGRTKTGAFLGRIVTPDSSTGGMYDDNKQLKVEIYFENCFASGSIEGTDKIGGFVGFDAGGANGSGAFSIAVYKNCYTTAMVGMDYAGGQLGGFIGHENTKSNSTAVIKDADGKQINVKLDSDGNPTTTTNPGAVHINCYAAGEVGNILTDTSTDQTGQDYLMLGGFLGVTGFANQDGGIQNNSQLTSEEVNRRYWQYHNSNKETATNGTYVNCYYDMQTTAMRERACGRADQFTTLTGADGNPIGNSQIPGVTGVYTQASELKGVAGLADTVDMRDNTAWKKDNADDQYPMLLAFDDYAKENFGTAHCNEDVQDDIQAQLNKKVETVQSYARASVSTALLNHWDLKMNMDTGSIAGESGWEPGLEQNKLSKVKDGDEKWDNPNMDEPDADGNHYHWEKTIKSLASGDYQFKIQQGNSWSHNFGEAHYSANGDEITLQVPLECNVTIRFKYDGHAVTRGESSNYEIWADFTNDSGVQVADSVKLGWNKNVRTINNWYVMGDMNGWASSTKMSYLSGALYEQSFELEVGSYLFKIAGDSDGDGVGDWTENYGQGGKRDGANMSFTLNEKSDITITFDEDTHVSSVSANPSSAITDIKTESESIEFTGYSVIAPKEITGHDWLDGLEAAQAGELSRQSDGTYRSKNFTITADAIGTGKNFGYKVIEDAVDSGQNRTFYLTKLPDGTDSINIYFTYDPKGNETHVYPVDPDMKDCVIDNANNIEFYSILGSRGLTNLDFDWDDNGLKAELAQEKAPRLTGQTTGEYTYTWQELPAGEYSFKVVGNGLFSSGVDYGANDGSGNYNFKISEASTVTITFTPPSNDNSAYIELEAVNSEGDNTLVIDRYVVSGNEQIAGVGNGWNPSSADNEMYYDEMEGIYTKTYDAVPDDPDLIYAFKIVEYGKDNTNHNISFSLQEFDENGDKIDYSDYSLKIFYYPNSKQTVYHLYDGENNRRDEYMIEPKISTYYVLGDANLTGNEWSSADGRGQMSDDDGDGIYEVTFNDVKVSPTPNTLSFKVVPNAGIEGQNDWYAGISYGDLLGGNYKIVLGSDTETSCSVKISFDTNTETISVETTPDCLTGIDESQFEWFICGDSDLVSSDAYMAEKTVYDTVRDITSPFEFTAFKNMTWLNDTTDTLSNRNSDNNYYSYLGGNEGANTGFNIDYTVDGKKVSGNFNTPVIKITETQVGDGDNQITKYTCENFMPGRRWVTVKVASDDDTIVGNRNIRLIPTTYLEAGVDSQIQVLRSGSDSDNIYNVVTYNNQGDDFEFKLSDGKSLTDPSVSFNYYNYALTAGYAITDINGIGYYGTYSGQRVQTYDAESAKKRPNLLNQNFSDSYFVMTSAYAQTESYSDAANNKFTDTSGTNTDTNLSAIDTLTSQSLIGSSYTSADSKASAPTIVKVFKLDKQEDENKWDSCLEFDGVYYQPTKVFMDSDSRSANSEYHSNYLKWTGQKAFEVNDAGYYAVVYYWSLADGRYLSDVKTVNIVSGLSTATKTAKTEYVEKNSQFTDKSNTQEIQYTVDYTNRVNGDFTVLDILPFTGDSRLASSSTSSVYYHTTGDFEYTLKDVSITVDKTSDDGTVGEQNVSYALYYTDDKSAQNLLPSNNQETAAIAQGIDLSDWTSFKAINAGHGSKSTYNIKSPATAIVLKGTQSGSGTSKISITFTLSVNGLNSDGKTPDRLWNNAFYSAKDSTSGNIINGYTQPVSTVAVGRKMSGFVWIDKDFDGKYDRGESVVQGVTVTLCKGDTVVKSVVTGDDGSYSFDDIYSPDNDYSGYYTKFSGSSDGKVTVIDSDGNEEKMNFNDLFISRALSQFYVDGNIGSRNVAVKDSSGTENNCYLITDQQLPDSEEIYKGNLNRMYYGVVNNYYYSKPNQNLALATKDYTTIKTKLKIHKVDTDTNLPMEGVEFMLEYRESEDYSYSTIYCIYDDESGEYKYALSTDEGAIQATNVTTNKNGDIQFTELPVGQYRFTEVSTLKGYNLFPQSIEVNLPYTRDSENSSLDSAVTVNDTDAPDGVYYDITYTVKNSKIPSLPITGVVNNSFIIIIIASIVCAVGIALTLIYKRKKQKN